MDYTELSSYQVDIHPSESLLSVAFDIVLDDPVVEGPEQFVITVETAAGDERVLLEQRDIEIFIISDDGTGISSKTIWGIVYFSLLIFSEAAQH